MGERGYLEFYKEGLKNGTLSVEDIKRAYEQGQLMEEDLCVLANEHLLKYKEVAEILGKSPSTVSRQCKKLLEEELFAPFKEAVEDYLRKQEEKGALAGRRGRLGAATSPTETPIHAVIADLSSRIVAKATQTIQQNQQIADAIYNLAYFYAARDPRYSESLKINPFETVMRFIEDAFAFYEAYEEIMARLGSIIQRLYYMIERYDSLIRKLLPRLYPSIRYEMEAKLALTIIDRMILARLLGIKLPRSIPKVAFLWMQTIGDKYLHKELEKLLWGV